MAQAHARVRRGPVAAAVSALEPEQIRALQKAAKERDPSYEPASFDLFFEADAAMVEDLEAFAAALRRWQITRSVEIEIGGPPPLVVPADDPRSIIMLVKQGAKPEPSRIETRRGTATTKLTALAPRCSWPAS